MVRKDAPGNSPVKAVTGARIPPEEREVFDTFCWLWYQVTNQNYTFHDHTLDLLFDKLRALRNYTRGHGVFTFEITREINLKLAEILVFLINRLIDSGLLNHSFQNLTELGWVIYAGETPWFLYCCDPRSRECRFDSFGSGSSLILPEDYR